MHVIRMLSWIQRVVLNMTISVYSVTVYSIIIKKLNRVFFNHLILVLRAKKALFYIT